MQNKESTFRTTETPYYMDIIILGEDQWHSKNKKQKCPVKPVMVQVEKNWPQARHCFT